jgi:hypothetical protein
MMAPNMRLILATASIAGCVGLQSSAPARATVLYDNLDYPSTFADSVRATNPTTGAADDGPLADSFSTGAGPFTLTDVKIRAQEQSRTPTVNGLVTVSLLSDSGTSPGSVLAVLGTFGDSQLSRTNSTVLDFTVAGGIALDPDTRYWIELTTDNNSRAGWNGVGNGLDSTTTAYGTGPGQWGIGGEGEYFFVGGAEAEGGYPTDVFPNGPGISVPYEMSVSGAVPEPSTWAMMLLGFGGVAFLACRRAKRNTAGAVA